MDKFELEHLDLQQQKELDKKIILTLSSHTPMIYFYSTDDKTNKAQHICVNIDAMILVLGEK